MQIEMAAGIEASCLAADERHSLVFCDNAESACRNDAACAPLIDQFNRDCEEMINGTMKNCSRECLSAVEALDANPIGSYMRRCSCGSGNSFCQRRGSYVSFYCFGSVWKVPQLCNDVLDACYDDSTCNETRHRYLMACNPHLNDDYDYTCSLTCKKYADIIYKDPVGGVLDSCFCRRSDDECRAYERITSRCFFPFWDPPPTGIPSTGMPSTGMPSTGMPSTGMPSTAAPLPADITYQQAFAMWKASYYDWLLKYEEWKNNPCPDGSGNA